MEILIISGLSGGGKSKAASFLEDAFSVTWAPPMRKPFSPHCSISPPAKCPSGRLKVLPAVSDAGVDTLAIHTGLLDKAARTGQRTIRAGAGLRLSKLAVFAQGCRCWRRLRH